MTEHRGLTEQEKKEMQEIENNDILMRVRSQILSFNPESKTVRPMFSEANKKYPNPEIDKIISKAKKKK